MRLSEGNSLTAQPDSIRTHNVLPCDLPPHSRRFLEDCLLPARSHWGQSQCSAGAAVGWLAVGRMERAMTLYVEDLVVWPPVFTDAFILRTQRDPMRVLVPSVACVLEHETATAQAPVKLLNPSGALLLQLEAAALLVLQLVAVTHPDCLLGSVIYINLEG